jgi:hypothetical protein
MSIFSRLEAKIHEAIERVHQSTPPDGLKNAAKAAVSGVVSAAEAKIPELLLEHAGGIAEAIEKELEAKGIEVDASVIAEAVSAALKGLEGAV